MAASGVRGTDRAAENPRGALVVATHVPSARPARWTAHCHAATASWMLTRAYQGDHRRYHCLMPTTSGAATRRTRRPRFSVLDNPFHIRAPRPGPRSRTACGFCALYPPVGRTHVRPRWSAAMGFAPESGLPVPDVLMYRLRTPKDSSRGSLMALSDESTEVPGAPGAGSRARSPGEKDRSLST